MSSIKNFLIGVILITGFAYALEATATPIQYEATSLGNGRFTTTDFGQPINMKFSNAGAPKYQQIIPNVSNSTLTKLAKNAIKGGFVSLAIVGAIEGVGYVIDQATAEITKNVIVTDPGPWIAASPYTGLTNLSQRNVNWCTTYNMQYCVVVPAGSRWEHASWSCNNASRPIGYEVREHVGRCFGTPVTTSQNQPITASDLAVIESTLSSNLSSSEKARIIRSVLGLTSISGLVQMSEYPVALGSTNPALNQLYQDWPELRTAVQAALNAQLSEQKALTDPAHTLSPDEQLSVDTSTVAPPIDTGSEETPPEELTLEAPPSFSATVEPWWVPIYPDGVAGIFSNFITSVSSGPFMAILNPLKTLPEGGTAPIWSMNFDIGVMGNYGTQSFEVPMLVWAFVRFCILFTAVMLVRKLIFGG
jgi:hypothetical protein